MKWQASEFGYSADCINGMHIDIDAKKVEVALTGFAHYEELDGVDMHCPYCKRDLWGENSSYEHTDDEFEDTYACDECNLLVTLITPLKLGEYHNMSASDCKYQIQFMASNEPSWWDENY